ncbi:MmgE/PrpD family protein [Domibacillus epiphyticus]|uniref:2-methylcitrate dehydratase n=1 Tax=Domibacillus epiphyticus TaxID=1714355 RepID=A0A1V2A4P6_9BACI|nr:MmgE/PrpD family protein [Domibacillus epiphyticus]OMP65973.1 2-methylcitrate dehydratase [Domibacillus epiphyticus]
MTLSKTLAAFVVNTSYDDLPKEAVEFTKICILDWAGSALAGHKKAPIQMINEMVLEAGGAPQSTLLTGSGKTSVAQAAFVNGASSHIVELDDIHKGSIIHAGTVVIPAALAVAEWKGSSGKEFIAAVALGYEICYRIGEAVSPSHYHYWHNTATCGTFGAAAAVSKLLHLNEEQIVHVLGSAGTQAAGLWEFIEDGAMSKQLHPGKAAMNGVISALLAEKGFTGAKKILEGDRGFFKAMSTDYDEAKITNGLGEKLKITENSFKIHASCRHTHPAIDLVLSINKDTPLQAEDIKKVQIKGYRAVIDITDNPDPDTIYASKFSVQFCAALAFIKNSAGMHHFKTETLQDKKIRQLMKKIEVTLDQEIDDRYPDKWGSAIKIELHNGQVIEKETDYPKGDPENPVSMDELVGKFRNMTMEIPQDIVEEWIVNVKNLEDYHNVAKWLPAGLQAGMGYQKHVQK